jgi:hypothetical protein
VFFRDSFDPTGALRESLLAWSGWLRFVFYPWKKAQRQTTCRNPSRQNHLRKTIRRSDSLQEPDRRIHFVSIRERIQTGLAASLPFAKPANFKARMTENQHVSAGPAETCFYEGKSAKMTKPAYLNLRFLAASDFFFLFTLGFS